jgi:hypothetical protein
MKKVIIPTTIIIVVIILSALIFDWGRRGPGLSDLNSNIFATGTVEQNSSATSSMPIVVNNIKDNQNVSNPIIIEGKARGNWFFEATFPVQLIDADGNIIASTTARALSDWATSSFVDFTATLEYTESTSTDRALIVLSKDNPSGNPEFDQSIYIPVILK